MQVVEQARQSLNFSGCHIDHVDFTKAEAPGNPHLSQGCGKMAGLSEMASLEWLGKRSLMAMHLYRERLSGFLPLRQQWNGRSRRNAERSRTMTRQSSETQTCQLLDVVGVKIESWTPPHLLGTRSVISITIIANITCTLFRQTILRTRAISPQIESGVDCMLTVLPPFAGV